MAKRGPKQEVRYHARKGWYYRDGNTFKYLHIGAGRKEDAPRRKRETREEAQAAYHTIQALKTGAVIPVLDHERARREILRNWGDDLDDKLTEAFLTDWIKASGMPHRQRELLRSLGLSCADIDQNPDAWQDIEQGGRRANPRHPDGLTALKRHIVGSSYRAPVQEDKPTGPKLRAALKVWQELKADEGCDGTYVADVERSFQRFVAEPGPTA